MDSTTRRLAPSFLPATAVLEMTYRCSHACLFCSCPWFADDDATTSGMVPRPWTYAWADGFCDSHWVGCGRSRGRTARASHGRHPRADPPVRDSWSVRFERVRESWHRPVGFGVHLGTCSIDTAVVADRGDKSKSDFQAQMEANSSANSILPSIDHYASRRHDRRPGIAGRHRLPRRYKLS